MKKHLLLIFVILAAMLPAQMTKKNYDNILRSQNIYEIDAFLRDAHPRDPRRSVLKPRLMDMLRDYIKNAHPADPRVKEMQEKLALLRTRESTKITFEEYTAKIRQKQIEEYKAELQRINSGFYAKKERIDKAETVPVATSQVEADVTMSGLVKSKDYAPAKTAAPTTTVSPAATPTAVKMQAAIASVESEKAEFEMLMNPTVQEHKSQTVKILNALFDNDPTSPETTVLIRNNSNCNMIMRMEGAGNLKYRLAIPAQKENTIVMQKGDYLFTSNVCGATYASQKTVQKALMVSLGSPN